MPSRAIGTGHLQLVDRYARPSSRSPEERLAKRALLNMMMEDETTLASEICQACGEVASAHIAPRGQHARLVAELTRAVHARDAFIAIAEHTSCAIQRRRCSGMSSMSCRSAAARKVSARYR